MPKHFYEVLEMCFPKDKRHFFSHKYKAIKFIREQIISRENKKPYPDRDIYDEKPEKRIERLFKAKKWLTLAPIYQLYLYKRQLNK